MVEGGLCKEQAQLVLPQGLFKTYLWEVNAKDLISFIEQNHSKSPEMAGYCNTLVLYMEDHLPQVTSYLKRNQWKDLI
jgi:thymidylate synthase ThyX